MKKTIIVHVLFIICIISLSYAAPTYVGSKRLYQNLNNLSDPDDDSGYSRMAIIYIDPTTNTLYGRLEAYDTTTGSAIAATGLPSRFPIFEESMGLTPLIPTLGTITIPGIATCWGFTATVSPHVTVYFSIIANVSLQYGPDSFADRSTRLRAAFVTDIDVAPTITSPMVVTSLLLSDIKTANPSVGEVFTSSITCEITSNTVLNSSSYITRVVSIPIPSTTTLINGGIYYVTGSVLSVGKRILFVPLYIPPTTPPPNGSGLSTGGVGINTTIPLSTLDINGNLSIKIVTLVGSASPSIINDGVYISINPQTTNQEFQLPNAVSYPGRIYIIRNINNTVTAKLISAGGLFFPKESITGSAELYMYENNSRTVIVVSDGANWTYFN